jgi:hypothetical protein
MYSVKILDLLATSRRIGSPQTIYGRPFRRWGCGESAKGHSDSWAEIARFARAPLIEVEVLCSDLEEHRARVESRRSDIEGLSSPSRQDVLGIRYERWSGPHIIVDTARKTIMAQVSPRLRATPSHAHRQLVLSFLRWTEMTCRFD